MTDGDRYSQIKEKLGFKKQEDININLEDEPKHMLSVYESNIDMFIDKSGKKLTEFFELCDAYESYDDMKIVQRAKVAIDSFEPILFNIMEEVTYMKELLKKAVGERKKEEKKQEAMGNTEKDIKIDMLLSLKEKGYSNRKIAETLGVSHPTVAKMLKDYEERVNKIVGNKKEEEEE